MASVFKRAIWRFVNFPAPEWVKVTGVVGGLCGLAVYLVAGAQWLGMIGAEQGRNMHELCA